MYTVYAIYNRSAERIYIGQTEDIRRRLNQHNNLLDNPSEYTARFKGLWELVYLEEYVSRQEALKREKQLKSYQGRQFIKRFIRA
jgi:putative endonuclease